MSEEEIGPMKMEGMDWPLYFSTLSDQGFTEISEHIHREHIRRNNLKDWSSLPPLNDLEIELLNENQLISAIKNYRNRTRVGLREAKIAIDKFRDKG
jgi:hypothetical protein